MKEKRLLVQKKNVKVNKKNFMLIFDQDILEQIVVCEYKKKNLCLFYFCLFNKGEWHSN